MNPLTFINVLEVIYLIMSSIFYIRIFIWYFSSHEKKKLTFITSNEISPCKVMKHKVFWCSDLYNRKCGHNVIISIEDRDGI